MYLQSSKSKNVPPEVEVERLKKRLNVVSSIAVATTTAATVMVLVVKKQNRTMAGLAAELVTGQERIRSLKSYIDTINSVLKPTAEQVAAVNAQYFQGVIS